MTSIDGPRTDVTDTVTFTHYPAVDGGYLHTVTNAENQTTTFSSYNAFGKPEQVTDANGVATIFGYDGMGRMTSKTTAGLTTGYTYDNAGRLTKITLPGTREIIYAYTDANLPESITDNAGNAIHYLYDDEGNRTREEVQDAGGVLQKYVDYDYDAFNRLWKVLYPGDGSPYEEYIYDGNDNLTGFRNANGHVTEYLYDALDRMESEIRPGAVTTGLDHDAADNLTRVTDPGANTTVHTHDDLGRTTRVDSPDAGITVYGHDPAGNVTARTDANGVTVTYGYDALNRLISASFPGGGEDLAFGYDAGAYGKGRLTSATDAAGSTTFTHDAPGRVTEEARVTDGISYATGYAYSAATGDLAGMTYPTGLALTFQRDAVGRISAVTAGGQTIAGNVAYLPFGPVEAMDLGAVSVTRTHDARFQVTDIQAGTLLNHVYTRDGMGNITGLGGATKPPFASGTTDYAYTANRLVSSTGAEPATYTYDNAGNITSDGARDFVYNSNNRLVRVEVGGTVIAEYAYDGFERRVKKVAGGVTTHYHYDLNGLLIAETDGAGNPIRDYVYLDGEPVAMQVYGAGAGWYWFLNDHLGTPQKLVDNAGAVVWQAAYMPFGEARILTAEVENNLRFPGQYYDAETGFHYNWHRYYDPETGRYLRPDPTGLGGGINPYTYVLNDPLNYADPYGLFIHRPGSKFIIGTAVRPLVNKMISDPAGQRIITSGISGAITGLGAGVIGGAVAGASATGPLAGI